MNERSGVCVHGAIRRQCETCEIADERDALRAELAMLRGNDASLLAKFDALLAERDALRVGQAEGS